MHGSTWTCLGLNRMRIARRTDGTRKVQDMIIG